MGWSPSFAGAPVLAMARLPSRSQLSRCRVAPGKYENRHPAIMDKGVRERRRSRWWDEFAHLAAFGLLVYSCLVMLLIAGFVALLVLLVMALF